MSEYFPDDDRSQLIERLVELVERMNHAMHCTPSDGWDDLDLTFQQLRVLALLFEGPQRMGSIANHMGSIMSSATSIIDRLVDKGLVARSIDPEDRRAVICQLTEAGRETMEQFWRIGRAKITRLAENLDTRELRDVVQAAGIMNRAARVAFPVD